MYICKVSLLDSCTCSTFDPFFLPYPKVVFIDFIFFLLVLFCSHHRLVYTFKIIKKVFDTLGLTCICHYRNSAGQPLQCIHFSSCIIHIMPIVVGRHCVTRRGQLISVRRVCQADNAWRELWGPGQGTWVKRAGTCLNKS